MIQLTYPLLANLIVNHPDVRPTMEKGEHFLDSTEIVSNPENVVFADEHTVIIFIGKGEGRFGIHLASMPEGRGAAVLKALRSALDRLFRDHGAVAVEAAIPLQLREVGFLARRLGFRSLGIAEDKPVEMFIMEAESWAA